MGVHACSCLIMHRQRPYAAPALSGGEAGQVFQSRECNNLESLCSPRFPLLVVVNITWLFGVRQGCDSRPLGLLCPSFRLMSPFSGLRFPTFQGPSQEGAMDYAQSAFLCVIPCSIYALGTAMAAWAMSLGQAASVIWLLLCASCAFLSLFCQGRCARRQELD